MTESSAEPISLLRHKQFGLYWWTRLLSTAGYQILQVAIQWEIYQLTSSALHLGLVGLIMFIPVIAGTFIIGHVADHYDRRRVIAICQLSKAAGALILIVVGLGLAVQTIERFSSELASRIGLGGGTIGAIGTLLGTFALTMLVVMLLYRFVPARRVRIQDAIAGAFVTTILLAAINLLSALVFQKTTQWSVIYGSLAVILVFLYSIYLYASAILVGAEVAAAWSLPPGPPQPIVKQVKAAVIGIFVHREPPPPPPEPRDHR